MENFSENKNRSDTSPVEDGSLFVELQNEHKMSFSEISAATGIPTSYVKNAVDAFLKTPTEFKPSVGYIVGGTKKKGKFSSAIVDMITRPHLSKEESKKLFAYVKSHDEATIHKVRLIVRLMTRSTNRLTFEQAIEKVDSLNVHTLFVVVKKDKAREAVKRYNKPLSRLMIEVLTGKIEPIPGLIYKGATRSDKEE